MAIKSRLPLGFNRRTDGRGTDTALAARFGPNDSISLIGAGRPAGRSSGPKGQSPKEGRRTAGAGMAEPFLQTGFGFRQREEEDERDDGGRREKNLDKGHL